MIYYRNKKLKKRLPILKADIRIKKKKQFDISSTKDAFFTGCVPNECNCTCLSYKSLSY